MKAPTSFAITPKRQIGKTTTNCFDLYVFMLYIAGMNRFLFFFFVGHDASLVISKLKGVLHIPATKNQTISLAFIASSTLTCSATEKLLKRLLLAVELIIGFHRILVTFFVILRHRYLDKLMLVRGGDLRIRSTRQLTG